MVDFKAIGRANPMGQIQQWQTHESSMASQRKNRAVQDLNMRVTERNMQADQMKIEAQVAQEKKLDEEIPWEIVSSQFAGGAVPGSPGEYVTNLAKEQGFLDMTQEGFGTISQRRKKELMETMSEPNRMRQFIRTQINWGRGQYANAQAELAKKPNDPKLQEAYQQAMTYYKDVTADAKGFEDTFKQAEDERTSGIKEYEYGLENPEFAASQEGAEKPEAGLTVSLFNPTTNKTVKVRRGSDYYDQFLSSGYEEGEVGEQGLPTQAPALDGAPSEPVDPLLTDKETGKGLGPMASLRQLANNVIGPFVEGQPYPETEESRNKIYTFNQRMRPFLQISSRGAKFDVDNINKILPNPDKFFQDPDAGKGKLKNLYNVINSSINEKTRLMNNAGTTSKQYKDFSNDINSLKEALSVLPVPGTEQQGNEYSNMSITEIQGLDLTKLTGQQRTDLEARVDAIVGGQ